MNPRNRIKMTAGAAIHRVRMVARHTVGEALHLRVTSLLGLMGAGLVVGGWWLREFNFGTVELKFIADFGLGAIGLFGTLLAALLTAQLFFQELETRAVYCVLTRPVRRAEYLAGKLAGVAAVLAMFTFGLGALLGGLLVWRARQLGVDAVALPVLWAACALQWFKLTLVAALTLLVSTYARSALFASGAGLMLALAGHLRGFAPESGAGWWRVWPDFSLFDAEALVAAGRMPGGGWLLGLVAYWAAYGLLFFGLAAFIFKRREL